MNFIKEKILAWLGLNTVFASMGSLRIDIEKSEKEMHDFKLRLDIYNNELNRIIPITFALLNYLDLEQFKEEIPDPNYLPEEPKMITRCNVRKKV